MFVLAFFLPLSLYLLALGVVHSRRRPLLVPGPWDFAGVLFAASGFLLYGGPLALSLVSDKVRMEMLLGRGPFVGLSPDAAWYLWLVLSVLYCAAVVAAAAYLLRRRARSAAVYNIHPDAVEPILEAAFARAGVAATRVGNSYALKPDAPVAAATFQTGAARAYRGARDLSDDLAAETASVEMDAFRALNHVTLRWNSVRSTLRDEVERELRKELDATEAPPSLLWLAFTGLAFLFFAVGFVGVLVAAVLRGVRV